MGDYGHDLQFGTFITPGNADPTRPVALAGLTESAGLDLVTFQDHPYQPSFLDAWTLLSYVAARTRGVHLALNVTNLPLRQPAVLARAAASLDLLSGGRVELGLGAGGFWDAIEAMGGDRRTPGQAMTALDEAIRIARGIWDVEDRRSLVVAGEHYRVAGAKRGPAPAHRIQIWLGAYKPRMLALTGRAADGWLPSLGYIQPADLAAANQVIDEAALAAGRRPADVRRLLNISGTFGSGGRGPIAGPVSTWVRMLTDLAIRDGISTFILGSDDADDIRRFAAEVAPQVREAVQAERLRGPSPDSPETGAVRVAAGGHPADGTGDGTTGLGVRPTSDGTGGGTTGLGVRPTPDDGVRRSTERPWDEASRPHRPPPDGARYTDMGREAGRHLIDVHDALRAELTQVRELVEQVRSGGTDVGTARSVINQMTMRQNNWTLGAYCESYCRVVTVHHSIEDRSVFPHLGRMEPGLEPVLDRLAAEHEVIHRVLDRVDAALVALAGDPDDLGGLQDAVDLLTDTMLSHLAYEEAELVEPLARHGFYPGQL